VCYFSCKRVGRMVRLLCGTFPGGGLFHNWVSPFRSVFIYSGHGEPGSLAVQNIAGEVELFSAAQLAKLYAASPSKGAHTRLVALSCCNSLAVGEALVQAGGESNPAFLHLCTISPAHLFCTSSSLFFSPSCDCNDFKSPGCE
jgi:hypothetical protein